jgi:16S rRNA (guanine527-N7)-methyltransferase
MMPAVDLNIGGQSVSRETMQRLESFESLVRHWNTAINLVSSSSLPDLWQRHIVDSAQLFPLCPRSARKWVDFGSGGGFPGIVVAILAKDIMPDLNVTLVEADLRKATFLRQAAQSLGLQCIVISQRAESVPPLLADVVSARALTSLSGLLAHAERHLQPDGLAVFPKGERFAEEVAEARQHWSFDLESQRSLSHSDAAILLIRKIKRANAA